jgi:hypothetical protein
LDHYTGPATILRSIGTRSFILQYTDGKGVTRTYQRDASMISPVPPKSIKGDPSISSISDKPPHLHRSLILSPIEEGDYVIIKDTKEYKTWYCAQVLEKLPDRIKVSYYTTTTPALANYAKVPYGKRLLRVQEAIFLKTWASPTGEATTSDPLISRRKKSQLWAGLVPLKFLDEVLLVRNVGLTAIQKGYRKMKTKIKTNAHRETRTNIDARQRLFQDKYSTLKDDSSVACGAGTGAGAGAGAGVFIRDKDNDKDKP